MILLKKIYKLQYIKGLLFHPYPFNNSFFHKHNSYIYYSGNVYSNTNICILSFCSGLKSESFIQLVDLCKQHKISLAPVFILNGGDCANPNCPGHVCNENCKYHSWRKKDGSIINIYNDPKNLILLGDRTDLIWDKKKKIIINYKDWGTAKNKCPYCGYKYQIWYLTWKKNIKQWKTTNQKGYFVRLDSKRKLGLGQERELKYLKKKKINFKEINYSELHRLINHL